MSQEQPKVTLNTNGLFGPTKNNSFYMPVAYHNKSAKKTKHKTTWVLKQNEQYEVFRLSDEERWSCTQNGGLFSIVENGKLVMGINEERLSFFPLPVNINDPYHGYPIDSTQYQLSDQLLEKWLEDGVIDNRIYIKILKGQL